VLATQTDTFKSLCLNQGEPETEIMDSDLVDPYRQNLAEFIMESSGVKKGFF
jgi:hypothetical protein